MRIDGEAGAGPDLVKRYHVVGYPTLMVLDAAGAEIDRVVGGLAGEESSAVGDLLSQLRGIREGSAGLPVLEKKLADNPKDPTLLEEVGKRHAYRGDARAVSELGAVATPRALLHLAKYYYLRGAKDYSNAEKLLVDITARAPKSPEASQVPYNLAIVYHETKRDPLARKVLDTWIAEQPKDVDRYNTYAWFCFKNNFDRARGVEVARAGLAVDGNAHALWDTLAELELSLGHRKEAVEAARRAQAIKPSEPYYAIQLKRFESVQGDKK